MKVILVNGGPHKDGCTNLALEEIAKTLEKEDIQTEIIWLGNKPIGGCIGCNSCEESQKDLNKDNKDKLIDDLNYILKENFEYVPLYKVINIADELIKRGWNFDKQIKE